LLETGHPQIMATILLSSSEEHVRLLALEEFRKLTANPAVRTNTWVVKRLVTQLYDPCPAVARCALSVLLNMSEDRAALQLIIEQEPALIHFGDDGIELLMRFLTVPAGFAFLSQRSFITEELERWFSSKAEDYVRRVENLLGVALSMHCDPNQRACHRLCSITVKSEAEANTPVDRAFLPVHFYGKLCCLPEGAAQLAQSRHVPKLLDIVRSAQNQELTGSALLRLKAALWSLGHIGSRMHGFVLLPRELFSLLAQLVTSAPVLSVRGTVVYVFGLLGRTAAGEACLRELGWEIRRNYAQGCVMRAIFCTRARAHSLSLFRTHKHARTSTRTFSATEASHMKACGH
jgi:rapamycin-insensitive companion of mTOR